MLDLPKSSVIIAGLEYWDKGEQILEPRLVDNLKDYFEKQGIRVPDLALHAPPPDDDDPASKRKPKIVAWQFPEWFITQTVIAIRVREGANGPCPTHGSPIGAYKGAIHRRGPSVSASRAGAASSRLAGKATSTTSTGTPSSIKVRRIAKWVVS